MRISDWSSDVCSSDLTVKLQIYSAKEDVQDRLAPVLKALDLGDIIGVRGNVRRTKRGEITVDSREIVVLAKALEQPPEKWHGMKTVDKSDIPQIGRA